MTDQISQTKKRTQNRLEFGDKLKLIEVLNQRESYASRADAAKYATEKMGITIKVSNIVGVEEHIDATIAVRGVTKPNDKLMNRIKDLEHRITHLERKLGVEPPEPVL